MALNGLLILGIMNIVMALPQATVEVIEVLSSKLGHYLFTKSIKSVHALHVKEIISDYFCAVISARFNSTFTLLRAPSIPSSDMLKSNGVAPFKGRCPTTGSNNTDTGLSKEAPFLI